MIEHNTKPLGASRREDGSISWCVWAPNSESVHLVIYSGDHREEIGMRRDDFGYHTCSYPSLDEGTRYAYRLSDRCEYPDPASRHQPDGVHRPSAVFFPETYSWCDASWRGVPREHLVIYELHVGAFTPEGTFDAAIARLPELASLGVTALELMPVAQFSGDRNWGYDGVHPFAVQNSYGGPRALQRLIDAAHRAGLAVLLDTVYNHFGPEGNYLGKFGPYLADRYHTPWGNAVNFDGPDSDSVRRFFLENARMWVRDFHVDGLRLDAVQTMYDFSAQHILAELQSVVQEEAGRQHRTVHMIAETDQNDVRLVQSQALGGHGLDGVWSDDFHHSVHALLTGECEGYYCDFGRAENLVKAFNDVYVYDGVYSTLRRRRHGNRVGNIDRTHFIVAVQNHDQTGNRALGERLGTLLPPEAQRLACALLLVSPCTPLLFMGEEYGETAPFPFFCSFSDERLIKAIRRGRRREFADLAFRWRVRVPDPQSVKTLDSAKLQWQWPEGSHHAQIRSLYADLLAARRRWPALRDRWHTAARLETVPSAKPGDSTPLLWVERGNDPGIVIVANLSSQNISPFDATVDRRNPILSTGELRYGGTRAIVQPVRELLPYELLVFGPREYRQ